MKMLPEERRQMGVDLIQSGLSTPNLFDIRRPINVADTVLGGVTVTSTSIDTRIMEIQHLRGEEALRLGGLGIEASYRVFTEDNVDVRERDIITANSGGVRYEVTFLEGLFNDHIEFLAKRALP